MRISPKQQAKSPVLLQAYIKAKQTAIAKPSVGADTPSIERRTPLPMQLVRVCHRQHTHAYSDAFLYTRASQPCQTRPAAGSQLHAVLAAAESKGRKRSAASAASWEEEDAVEEVDAVDLTEDDTRISQVTVLLLLCLDLVLLLRLLPLFHVPTASFFCQIS